MHTVLYTLNRSWRWLALVFAIECRDGMQLRETGRKKKQKGCGHGSTLSVLITKYRHSQPTLCVVCSTDPFCPHPEKTETLLQWISIGVQVETACACQILWAFWLALLLKVHFAVGVSKTSQRTPPHTLFPLHYFYASCQSCLVTSTYVKSYLAIFPLS